MAGLQRSAVSFRRQGSSGLVWNDKLNQLINQQNQDVAAGAGLRMERSRSAGGEQGFRSGKVASAAEPPSPKVYACGFCAGAFGKHEKNRHLRPPRSGKSAV